MVVGVFSLIKAVTYLSSKVDLHPRIGVQVNVVFVQLWYQTKS